MKPTIYDVAKEAGVSIATVSNAINGKGKISKKRREEIFKIMERLQYQPSVIASALTGKKTYTLGLLIPDISNPFFAEIARAIEDQASQSGYSVIICSTDNRDDRIERYISLLEQKSVDGFIIGTGVENMELLAQMQNKPAPVVMVAREVPSLSVHTVVTDDFVGGVLAARHLLELGHRDLAVLSESLKVSSSRERLRGFRSVLDEAGLILGEADVITCDYRIEDGKRGALELFGRGRATTAIFCVNDLLAIGALQAAKEAGLAVPDDLSVIGFDDTILASVTNPALSTVAQPIGQMAKVVLALLMQNFQDPHLVKQRIVLRPELIVRQSTAEAQSHSFKNGR